LCGLISCVSQHKHLLVHLSCHSITKTKQGPFNEPKAHTLLGDGSGDDKIDGWCLDTGATHHMTG
jgi:hypothetical protein